MAAAIPLDPFQQSWRDADEYPLNLIRPGSNNGSLQAHRNLLVANQSDLFYTESEVVVIEFNRDGQNQGMFDRNHLNAG